MSAAYKMTELAKGVPYEEFIKGGWTPELMEQHGYAEKVEPPVEVTPVSLADIAPAAASLEDAKRVLDEAATVKVRLMKSGTPEEKAAAEIAFKQAHTTYWELQRQSELVAPGAIEAGTPEMRALDPAVRDALLQAPPQVLFLHNDSLPANVAAERMFNHLGATGEMYRRGSAVVELDDENRMQVLTPTAFRSRLNKRGRKVMAFKKSQTGAVFPADKHCGEDVAKVLLATSEVLLLPEIKLVVAMPLLVERSGQLIVTQPGYNHECGVLVTGIAAVRDIPLDEAAGALLDLLRDFNFATPGDKARALAGLVAPALRMGALISGNALIDMVEADQSQAGKGTKHQVTHAIYGEQPYPVTKTEGGVGSFDESLCQALMTGAPFIALDNLRGNLNSTKLEHSITPITKDGRVAARVPHRGEVMVDAGRTLFQATSNGFSSTLDLANRLLITRLLRQPAEYQFVAWPEGGLLQRIAQHAAYYLSCVHAVIRHWHAAGKPKLPTSHSFKNWVGSLDWIVQNVWSTVPLLDGHTSAAARIANPSLSWLRQVAFAVLREGRGGVELRAGDLREICERCGLMPEGVKPSHEDNQAERAIGRMMAACFPKADAASDVSGVQVMEVDGVQVTRIERDELRVAKADWRPNKYYVFKKL
jgi:hypothetical protein